MISINLLAGTKYRGGGDGGVDSLDQCYCITTSVRIAQLVQRWTRDSKVENLIPGKSSSKTVFSRVSFLCWLLFSIHSTCELLQRHVKDPSHSAKSAGDRSRLDMHTSWAQWSWSGLTMLSMHSVRTHQGNKLTHNSSGNTHPQSCQFIEPLWTDPVLKNGIGTSELIYPFKKKKKSADWKWCVEPSPQILVCEEKTHHHHQHQHDSALR